MYQSFIRVCNLLYFVTNQFGLLEYNPKYRYPDELTMLRNSHNKLLQEDISPSKEFERMILCHVRDKDEVPFKKKPKTVSKAKGLKHHYKQDLDMSSSSENEDSRSDDYDFDKSSLQSMN